MKYISINPTNGRELQRFNTLTAKELEIKLQQADFAYDINRTTDIAVRSKRLTVLAECLLQKKEELAYLMTVEMGKPIHQALAEIEKCTSICHFYAENAKQVLSDKTIETPFSNSIVQFAPLGIVLGIMPWNFPFWQVFRYAIPALVAGNTVLLKHAPNVPQCANALEQLFIDAQFPEYSFQNIFASNKQVGQIIADERVQGVAFTGSLKAGSIVAEQTGKNIKKTVLELGGNDACIILADANLKNAAETAILSRMLNTGQSCIAAKRWIVDKKVIAPFLELVTEMVQQLKIDDPRKPDTDIGPMARADLRQTLIDQINASVKKGASVLIGGNLNDNSYKNDNNGYFFEPTILTDVVPGMPAFDEELFGPVGSIIVANNEHHAIELANKSQYGLGAAIWTTDITMANKLAKQLQVGNVFINGMVQSNVHLPFGGIKKSGIGRELSKEGLLEFVNVKTIVTI